MAFQMILHRVKSVRLVLAYVTPPPDLQVVLDVVPLELRADLRLRSASWNPAREFLLVVTLTRMVRSPMREGPLHVSERQLSRAVVDLAPDVAVWSENQTLDARVG